eukprot:1401512-Alexandrium_andersonii.AAC.1
MADSSGKEATGTTAEGAGGDFVLRIDASAARAFALIVLVAALAGCALRACGACLAGGVGLGWRLSSAQRQRHEQREADALA